MAHRVAERAKRRKALPLPQQQTDVIAPRQAACVVEYGQEGRERNEGIRPQDRGKKRPYLQGPLPT